MGQHHERRIDDRLDLSDDVAPPTVERGLNEIRLALLGILVTIALTVAFGVEGAWCVQVAAGLAAFVAACLLAAVALRWEPATKRVMALMHRLTGR
jgi:hypothetical protein